MTVVVDASFLGTVLSDDGPDGERARARLSSDPELSAPHLIDLEVTSWLRREVLGGRMDSDRARRALVELALMRMVRYPHTAFLQRIWELRHNVSAYDASYVALAEALGAPLLTADIRLANAPGIRCEVERFE
ncbi:MAG: type II toxin-antitoxin system VapC family toxin [Acidimicrobiales bacterium]